MGWVGFKMKAMGYRNYLASLPLDEYKTIKGYSMVELFVHHDKPLDDCVSTYDVAYNDVFAFGKYAETFEGGYFTRFFENDELHQYMTAENEFAIVGKEFLKAIIHKYEDKIKGFYTDLMKGVDLRAKDFKLSHEKGLELLEQVRGMSTEWLQFTPYDLDKGEEVTTSWKYEYAQFELVRIYKTFDFENNVLVWHGW